MGDIRFNSKMVIAWGILSFLLIGMVLPRLMSPAEPSELKLVLFAICILNPGILVFLIRALRGPNKNWRDTSLSGAQLSAWGYFWRAYVGWFMQFPVFLLAKLVVPIDLQVNRFSAFQLILWEVPFVVASTVGIWLLFSRDHKGQAQALVVSLRGY